MKDYLIHFILCIFAGIGISFMGLLTAIQLHNIWHLINFDISIYTVWEIGMGFGMVIGIIYAIPYIKAEHKRYKESLRD